MEKKLMIISVILISTLGIICGLSIGQLFIILSISLGIYTPILFTKKKLNKSLKVKEEKKQLNQIKEISKVEEKKKTYSPTIRNDFLKNDFTKEKILVKKKSY